MDLLSALILMLHENIQLGYEFRNSTTNLLKCGTYKIVIDARLLNATTDISKCLFPLLPVQVIVPRTISTINITTDLPTAYHQSALTPKNRKLVHFVVGSEQYKNERGFYGLKGLPFFNMRNDILFPTAHQKE